MIKSTTPQVDDENNETLPEINEFRIYAFFKTSYHEIKEIIRIQLNHMDKKGLITHEKWFFFKKDDEASNIIHTATEEENQDIISIQKKILEKYKIVNIETVYSYKNAYSKAKAEYEEKLKEYINSKSYSSYLIGYRIAIAEAGRAIKIDESLIASEELKSYVSKKVRNNKNLKKYQSVFSMDELLDDYFSYSP